jgi:hypothetical protein
MAGISGNSGLGGDSAVFGSDDGEGADGVLLLEDSFALLMEDGNRIDFEE